MLYNFIFMEFKPLAEFCRMKAEIRVALELLMDER